MRENKGSFIRFSARLSIKDKQKKMNLQINPVQFILLCTARFKFCCMNGHLFQLRYSNPWRKKYCLYSHLCGMATLDSGTVRLQLSGSSSFSSPGIVWDYKKAGLCCFRETQVVPTHFPLPWEKESWGSNPPWCIRQLPWEEESWGSNPPRYIWQLPWEEESCGSKPRDTLETFSKSSKTLGIMIK